MRTNGITGFLVGLALTLLISEAHAQCPSAGYFRADASNAIGQFGKLDTTACLAITTATTQINAKAVVTVQIADTRKLQEALIARLSASSSCALTGIGGWDITDLNVSFSGSGASSRVRVNVVGRDCVSVLVRGRRLTFDAPVIFSIANNVVTIGVDTERARVSFTRSGGSLPFIFATAANRIGTSLNEALGSPLDLSGYIPPQARPLNPSVTQVAFSLQANRLLLKVNISGRVNKPDADRLLSDTIQDQAIPRFLRWLNQGVPVS